MPLEAHTHRYTEIFALALEGALVVPTQSLAALLLEEFALVQLALGKQSWVRPNIITWSGFVSNLWRINQRQDIELASLQLLDSVQSRVVWERVLTAAKYQDDELRLLNVVQTAKAAQAAYHLCLDCCLSEQELAPFTNIDLEQYHLWAREFDRLCSTEGLLDAKAAPSKLGQIKTLENDTSSVAFYAFDAFSPQQHRLVERLKELSTVKFLSSSISSATDVWSRVDEAALNRLLQHNDAFVYANETHQLQAVFQKTRAIVEQQPKTRVGVVIPNLHSHRSAVERIAQEVFYPQWTTLQTRNAHKVYRFSLGEPLVTSSAIASALLLLKLMGSRILLSEFRLLLTSRYHCLSSFADLCYGWLDWLSKRGHHTLEVSKLVLYLHEYAQSKTLQPSSESRLRTFIDLFSTLLVQRDELCPTSNAKCSMTAWTTAFSALLKSWQWQTAVDGQTLDSLAFQLQERFDRVLLELNTIDPLGRKCGVTQALRRLQDRCQDIVFQGEAEPAPIYISGVFEAAGRSVDHLFILDLDDEFPSNLPTVPFIPRAALQLCEHPFASIETYSEQMRRVVGGLLLMAQHSEVSYSQQRASDPESKVLPSPFIRHCRLNEVSNTNERSAADILETYDDSPGSRVADAQQVKHGMQVFMAQSACPFQAYATHRLGCEAIREPELGLEPSTQGSFVHKLLEVVWQSLKSSSGLTTWLAQDDKSRYDQVLLWFDQAITKLSERLTDEQLAFLQRERERYPTLIQQWLEQESRRPEAFSVLNLEQRFAITLGGIQVNGRIDRIDQTSSGHCVIVDYKTGSVSRKDWQGERLPNPQMPLYAVAQKQLSNAKVAAVAYGKVRRQEHKFEYMGEAGIFSATNALANARAQEWQRYSPQWPEQLTALADEFLNGVSQVAPVEKNTCRYCAYTSLCRIQQLQPSLEDEDADE